MASTFSLISTVGLGCGLSGAKYLSLKAEPASNMSPERPLSTLTESVVIGPDQEHIIAQYPVGPILEELCEDFLKACSSAQVNPLRDGVEVVPNSGMFASDSYQR